jgi:phosphoadenosine phosphosulfate reductase
MEEIKDLYGNDDIEAMYQAALRVPLADKFEITILTLRNYEPMALSLSPDGYYACNSGGKDSGLLMRLLKMSGVKYKGFYNNVTIDPPELVQHLKRHYPETIWNNPPRHLCSEIINHAPGLPTRNGRWCCQVYKEQGGLGLCKTIGVRASESPRRKGLWQIMTKFKSDLSPILSPILYWTDEDVWNFTHDQDIPYCSLYDETDENGEKLFKRLGCVGCPLGGKNRAKEFKRWPKYEELWKRGGRAWWEKYRIATKENGESYFAAKFKTFEDYWAWWMEEKNVNDTDQPDCQMFLW